MRSTPAGKQLLLGRIDGLHQIPTIPAVIAPLLTYLQQPLDQIDVQKVIGFLAHDESLAAQCLRMANSPLFGNRYKVETLRGAAMSLGIQRVSDIAMSCTVLNMLPHKTTLNPVVFWEHSLGCALVCRRLAHDVNLGNPGKAYLAGLLHDLGIIVNLWVLPEEFDLVFNTARAEGIPLDEAEQRELGFTHCDSGRLLGQNWDLAPELIEVLAFHHCPDKASQRSALVALVHVADLLCRMSGLNYGYIEERQVNLFEDSSFAVLAQHSPSLKNFDWARLTLELDSYLDEVHSLVRAIYRT